MADQRFQTTENIIGANHPTLTDTVNRLTLVEHNTDGTHKAAITGLAVTAGKTLTATNTLTLSGTDATTMTFPSTTGTVVTLNAAQTLTNKTLTAPELGVATGTSFNSITALASAISPMDGSAAVGTSTTVARQDHVHPSDAAKAFAAGERSQDFEANDLASNTLTTGRITVDMSSWGNTLLTLKGSTDNNKGSYISFTKNTTDNSFIGDESVVIGGTGSDLTIFTNTGNGLKICTNNSSTPKLTVASDGSVLITGASTFTSANLIQPATDVAGLTIRAHASATAAPLQIQTAGSAALFTVSGAGAATGTSFNSITGLSSTAADIKINGTQSAGSLTTVAKADHIHPSDTTRALLGGSSTQPFATGALTVTGAISANTSGADTYHKLSNGADRNLWVRSTDTNGGTAGGMGFMTIDDAVTSYTPMSFRASSIQSLIGTTIITSVSSTGLTVTGAISATSPVTVQTTNYGVGFSIGANAQTSLIWHTKIISGSFYSIADSVSGLDRLTISPAGAITIQGTVATGALTVTGVVTASDRITATGTNSVPPVSGSTTTLGLTVIGGNACIDMGAASTSGNAYIQATAQADRSLVYTLNINKQGGPVLLCAGAVTVSSTGLSISPTTASTSTTTGALVVAGGVGIAGAAYVGGALNVGGDLIHATKTPASATATGTTGTIAWDASYVYVCTATNTWKRTAIATW